MAAQGAVADQLPAPEYGSAPQACEQLALAALTSGSDEGSESSADSSGEDEDDEGEGSECEDDGTSVSGNAVAQEERALRKELARLLQEWTDIGLPATEFQVCDGPWVDHANNSQSRSLTVSTWYAS